MFDQFFVPANLVFDQLFVPVHEESVRSAAMVAWSSRGTALERSLQWEPRGCQSEDYARYEDVGWDLAWQAVPDDLC